MNDIALKVSGVASDIKNAFEHRASRYMFRTFNPIDIARAWENKDTALKHMAEWEMMVAVTKARMSGHFEAEVIRDARLEIESP